MWFQKQGRYMLFGQKSSKCFPTIKAFEKTDGQKSFFFLFPFLSCLSSPLLFCPFSCHLSFLQFLPSHHFSFSFLFLPLSPLFSPPSFVMFYVSNAKVEIWEQYQKSFLYLFHQVFKSLVWVKQGYVPKNMLLIKKYWRLLFTNVSVFILELLSPFQFGYMNYVFLYDSFSTYYF